MAVTESRALHAPWIEALGEKYGTAIAGRAATPFTKPQLELMAPKVIKPTGLQDKAIDLTTAGLGAYQPYVTQAGTQLGAAGTGLGGVQTGLAGLTGAYAAPATTAAGQAAGTLAGGAGIPGVQDYIGAAGTGLGQAGGALAGAQTQMGGAQQYISQAAGLTGPMTGAQMATIDPTTGQTVTPTLAPGSYMSPYQSQVIDTTLAEFDKQAAMRQQAISDAAVGLGGFGGGREGVMQSEYQLGSDKNRAALEAQLLNQGFSQAQAARQADMAARIGIGGAQQQYASGLAGLAGQEAQFAQGQLGLGGALQSLAGAQIGAGQAYLQPGQFAQGVLGQQAGLAGQRAQLAQAQLGAGQTEQAMLGRDVGLAGQVGATQQAQLQAQADAQREFERMQLYEPYERISWLGQGLQGIMGGMAPQYTFSQQPNPSPLAQALGIAATGAGAYKAFGGS